MNFYDVYRELKRRHYGTFVTTLGNFCDIRELWRPEQGPYVTLI